MRVLFTLFYVLVCLFCLTQDFGYCEDGAQVSMVFEGFYPVEEIQQGIPFEIVFRLKNTGESPINPYADVSLSGDVYDSEEELLFRIVDKQYKIFNLWPGEQSPKEKFYIGALEKGSYLLKIKISAFNRVKGIIISRETIELKLNVK